MYENFVAQKYMLSYSHIFPSKAGNVHITVIESPPELALVNQISTAYELGDPTTMVHVGSPSGSRRNTWSARWESSIKARQLEHARAKCLSFWYGQRVNFFSYIIFHEYSFFVLMNI